MIHTRTIQAHHGCRRPRPAVRLRARGSAHYATDCSRRRSLGRDDPAVGSARAAAEADAVVSRPARDGEPVAGGDDRAGAVGAGAAGERTDDDAGAGGAGGGGISGLISQSPGGLNMRLRAVFLLLAPLAACGTTQSPGPSTTSLDTTSSEGSGDLSASVTTFDSPTTTEVSEASSLGGLEPDLPAEMPCNPYTQECPLGMKCNVYSTTGVGLADDVKCVEVVAEPDQVGEACVNFDGEYSGKDSCEKGSVCFETMCTPLCTGSSIEPICEAPHTFCYMLSEEVAFCRTPCSPFTSNECEGGFVCDVDPDDPGGFVCGPDLPDGGLFEGCIPGVPGACDATLTCLTPAAGGECDPNLSGCCLPYCLIDAQNICPGEGQVCVPFFADPEVEAAPGLWTLGICTLP